MVQLTSQFASFPAVADEKGGVAAGAPPLGPGSMTVDDPEVMGAMDDVCSQLEKFYAAPAALVSAFDSLLPLVSGQTAEDVRAALKTRGKGEETADGVDKLRAVLNDLDALQRIIDQAAAPRPAAPAPPSFGDAPPDETADAAATSSDEKKDAEEGQEGEAKASEGEEGENAEEEEEIEIIGR